MRKLDDVSPTSPEAIARRVVLLRKALGMRPVDICRLTGIRTNTWSQWEAGTRVPDLHYVIPLCDQLGITLDFIYRGDLSGLSRKIIDGLARIDSAA